MMVGKARRPPRSLQKGPHQTPRVQRAHRACPLTAARSASCHSPRQAQKREPAGRSCVGVLWLRCAALPPWTAALGSLPCIPQGGAGCPPSPPGKRWLAGPFRLSLQWDHAQEGRHVPVRLLVLGRAGGGLEADWRLTGGGGAGA